jgi:GAF domain-containing protein
MREQYEALLAEITDIAKKPAGSVIRLQEICNLLKVKVTHYDWVGFYLVNPKKTRELVLGPFAGEPTEHICIPFGKGICGQAAETREIFVIDDVEKESNYLSCNINVKSEIVIPIFRDGEIVGELDLDSHQKSAFNKKDEGFLKQVGEIISKIL